jgi:voltage-gated potassium channel
MSSAFFLALRRMRAPLIVLIVIFAISVFGLTLIPGVDAEGKPWRMGFFHALYFISYTATTIGFGEIPNTFTDAQRLWVIFCIYMSVVGWAYAIGKLLAVAQDRGVRQALTTQRFARTVRNSSEPFYLVCGYGETGRLLCRSLDQLDMRFIVIDIDPQRIDEIDLQGYWADAPGLVGDARLPHNLLLAGLDRPYCLGVIALTSDDTANLAVAIAARLLNPGIPALCRATVPEIAANMASFGTRHIINPFEKFGEYLALAVRSPGSYQLLEWLTGIPGTELAPQRQPPRGHWLVCGYGRFGQAIHRHIEREGLNVTIIDPKPVTHAGLRWVVGVGTQAETLHEANIEGTVGIIAGTDDDIDNLSIVVTARELNPDLFVVLRQNLQANHPLFQAFHSDFVVVPSEVIAHECLAILTTPLLSRFLEIVKRKDDTWADGVVTRLAATLGTQVPTIWSVTLSARQAPALIAALRHRPVPLEALLRDSSNREEWMPCVPLMAVRGDREFEMPPAEFYLTENDRILFAGLPWVAQHQQLTLTNVNVLHYVLLGKHVPTGWLWRKVTGVKAFG